LEHNIIEEYKSFVLKIRNLGVDVCVWKDTTHVKSGISKDIDLYISDFEIVKYVLNENGFLLTKNTKGPTGFLFHAYKRINNKLLHLHLYTKLFSGSSWIKQYDFEYYIPELIKTSKENDLAIPSDKIIFQIEKIRFKIKHSTFLDRILLNRSDNKTAKEIETISGGLDMNIQTVDFSNLKLRYSTLKKYLFYFYAFMKRVFGFFYGHKPLKGGSIIVVHGSDGSGKSSTINMLSEYYNNIIKVKKFTTGNLRNSLGIKNKSKKKKFKKTKAILIAVIRLFITKKAKFYSFFGFIVFMDRWPTNKLHTFDGPRLDNLGFLGKVELIIYNLIPRPNLAIGLDPGVENLILRNSLRIKDDKETSEEIAERYELWKLYIANAAKEIKYKNINSIELDFNKINSIILKEIS